jgi:hypothetical protein
LLFEVNGEGHRRRKDLLYGRGRSTLAIAEANIRITRILDEQPTPDINNLPTHFSQSPNNSRDSEKTLPPNGVSRWINE